MCIVVSFLTLIDAVIWSAGMLVFNIFNTQQSLIMCLIIWGLSLCFIVATVLGNYFYNWFTRIYYTVTAVWIGTTIYLFIVSFIYSILVFISNQTLNQLGVALFCLSFALSIYGVLHAKNIQIKTVPDNLGLKSDIWFLDLPHKIP